MQGTHVRHTYKHPVRRGQEVQPIRQVFQGPRRPGALYVHAIYVHALYVHALYVHALYVHALYVFMPYMCLPHLFVACRAVWCHE